MTNPLKVIFLILVCFTLLYWLLWKISFRGGRPVFGATVSDYYARELGLDPREVYSAVLRDLNPGKLRLVAYWQYLEPERGKFNFADLDWQVKEAAERNKEIILVLGGRVPRWPECHTPRWAREILISSSEGGPPSGADQPLARASRGKSETRKEEFQKALLNYIKEVVNHYKIFPNIKVWQVENEPLLDVFGECPKEDRKFLKREIEEVKKLDPRPVMVTDSGELSLWLRSAGLSEILGTTLYRTVWNKYIGWSKNIYPPVFYTLRAEIAKKLFGNSDIIVSELQAEPWTANRKLITEVPFGEQTEHFDVKELKSNVDFALRTGLKEIYLWGVEWWYWRRIHGDDSFWNAGKEIFRTAEG